MPVFHLDIESFMTAVERIKRPEHRRVPLVIAPASDRAPIIASSPDAKALGLTRGAPAEYVKRHYPDVRIVRPDYALYDRANRYVLGLINHFSPIVEPIRYGHIAMDMTGMTQLFGNLENAALKLTKEIRKRAGLQATVGIASNKLVGAIAAKEIQKENQTLHQVRTGDESPFLAPVTCRALPEWDEAVIRRLLFELNLRRIGQVQTIPRDIFSYAVGAAGLQLHRHAMGIDPQPVNPTGGDIIHGEHHFTPDTNDDSVISATIFTLLENLCHHIRSRDLASDRLTVAIKFTDDVWRRRHYRFSHTQQEDPIHKTVMTRFEKLCDRRRRVRYVLLELGGLCPWRQQRSLFEEMDSKPVLPQIDLLRMRYGAGAIQFGKGVKGTDALDHNVAA